MALTSGKKKKTIGEFERIARWTKRLKTGKDLVLGVGDDAALFAPPKGMQLAATCDLLVEDVHFRHTTIPATDLGYKSLAVSLSDLAAMGAKPWMALLSLAIPKSMDANYVDDFYKGLRRLADRSGCLIAGGDTTGSMGPMLIDIFLLGLLPTGKALRRDGARVGDSLWVCGSLGLSRAGLEILENKLPPSPVLVKAHRRPTAHLTAGSALLNSGRCTSCIDVSDGLLGDLAHLAERSGVGFEIERGALPIPAILKYFAKNQGKNPLDYVLHGGEDYALLFTLRGDAPPTSWPENAPHPVKIGRVLPKGFFFLDKDGRRSAFNPKGFDHFA